MRNARNPAMLAAVAAGLLAGSYIGARRPGQRAKRYELATLATRGQLLAPPAPIVMEPPEPVIIDARFEVPARRAWLPWSIAVLTLFALVITAVFAARPRFAALAAPPDVLAGSAATISYTTSGIGKASFTSNDGTVARSGHLGKDGTLTLPVSSKSHELIAVLQMQNAFGTDARVVRVRVVPLPAPLVHIQRSNAPFISELRLSKTSAPGGATIAASFATNAPAGNIRLVDAQGAVWASRPIRNSGTVAFAVPLMHRDTPFIVVIHAQRNNRAIEASAGFVAQAKSGVRAPAQAGAHFAQPSFAIPAVVRGGRTFAVSVPTQLSGVNISLSSKDGDNVAGPFTQRGRAVHIGTPVVSAPQQTFVTLSFINGMEREVLVRRILIVP